MFQRVGGVLLLLSLALAGCGAGGSEPEEQPDAGEESGEQPGAGAEAGARLGWVESWAYQLQDIDLDALAASDFDLLVMDYAGGDGRPFSAGEIATLHESGHVVLSYLSIGEAETYRPYWDPAWVEGEGCAAPLAEDAPGWLDPANPDWCGNYAVRFWDEEWQAIVFDYLDAILAAGFDGAYLDKVDIFYYWLGEEDLGASSTNPGAAQEMAAFVETIADYGRAQNPDFIVVPQNAPEILDYLSDGERAAYLSSIDGIAVEDTFFFPPDGSEVGDNAPYDPQTYVLDLLEVFQEAGVLVLAVDYVSEPDKVDRFYQEAEARGFVPYATTRELDRLTVNEGHLP